MKPDRLSSRLSLSVAVLGLLLVALLSALAYFSLSRQLDGIAEQSLKDKLQQVRHSLREVAIRPEVGSQTHNIRDLIQGHDSLSLTLYDDSSPPKELMSVGLMQAPLQPDAAIPAEGIAFHYWQDEQGKALLTASQLFQRKDGSRIRALLTLDRASDQALLRAYIESTLIALPFVLALIAAGAWWIAHRGLISLNQFRTIAERVSTDDLSHRLPVENLPQELRELANGINFMFHRLDGGVQQLSQFSDDLAHELRSPISNLIGKAQVTLSRERPPEEYKRVLENCTEELGRVTRIISDMLFLAHVSHPAALVPFERLRLHEEAEKVAELFSLMAEDKQVTLKLSGQATISGDRLMVQRAISNLLSNAITHSPAGSNIDITLSTRAANVTLAVSNQGAGIAAEHLPKLFERFYRVDNGRSRADSGTGLGLAIVRSIMSLHRGQVSVSSNLDATTVFTLHFPLPQPDAEHGKNRGHE
ncbi:Sensor protein [Pseudomonas sp. 8Z]|uniref:heavy metal sensor histidine kinase n=1 Tax=Pseudomonas sp. 8Z TaxID=2653166 RepID=UPI0012F09AAC|nr:heavy metal sensor histidine kinase [Pseudomonas sp. 8Z]VXC47622.1 Sensor protein [Pseudomonas sp. 8Z]